MRSRNVLGVGGCLQSELSGVVLGTIEAAISKRAHSTSLISAGRGLSAGTAEDDVTWVGCSLEEQDDLCVCVTRFEEVFWWFRVKLVNGESYYQV